MIRSFRDKDTQAFFGGNRIRRFEGFAAQAERRMQIFDSATGLEDVVNLPSNRLEVLSGDRKGPYNIRINHQWRICFRWLDEGPHDVEVTDYH
jgi:proteic killer suppression protein